MAACITCHGREGQATNPNNHVLIGTLNLITDFTDGIEVTSVALGANYPAGLLVVGVSGLLIERVLLRTLERATVNRWGTVRELT